MNNILKTYEIDANYENLGKIEINTVEILSSSNTDITLNSSGTLVKVDRKYVIENESELSKITYGGFDHDRFWYVPVTAESDILLNQVIQSLLTRQLHVLHLNEIEAVSFINDMNQKDFNRDLKQFIATGSISSFLNYGEAELIILQTRHNKILFESYEGLVKVEGSETVFTATSYNEGFNHYFTNEELLKGKPLDQKHHVLRHEVLLFPADSDELVSEKLTAARLQMIETQELKLNLIARKQKAVQSLIHQ